MYLTDIRPITQTGVKTEKFIDGRPCFSPDGKTVLFERSGASLNFAQFWSVLLDNVLPEKLFYKSDSYNCLRAAWSWFGDYPQAIAFTGTTKKESTIMLVSDNATNNSAKCLNVKNYASAILSYPAWYPDGESLLISNYSNYRLIKLNIKTQEVLLITPELFMSGMGTVSAANSNMIAFAGQPRNEPYDQFINQIWIQDGHNDPELFSSDAKGAIGRAPWFSPDGSLMAFEAKGNNNRLQIFLKPTAIPYQNLKATQVSEATLYAQHAKFSPDGKTLIWAQQTRENCSQIYCGTIIY
jgi:Tol biopolymer transport system component